MRNVSFIDKLIGYLGGFEAGLISIVGGLFWCARVGKKVGFGRLTVFKSCVLEIFEHSILWWLEGDSPIVCTERPSSRNLTPMPQLNCRLKPTPEPRHPTQHLSWYDSHSTM